jgi:hypothetical protein
MHHTKDKGDIAAAMALADLTLKGYICFTPTVSEHLPFDLIAYKDGKCLRIQAKYNSNRKICNKTSWADKNGSHSKRYGKDDFDYYALYIPDLNRVLYPNISFGGNSIAVEKPKNTAYVYWWEDFLDFTDKAERKNYKIFGYELNLKNDPARKAPRINHRKVERPSKEELNELIWSKPMTELSDQFGVSDRAIARWIKYYGLEKPPIGHWIKNSVKEKESQ